MSPQHRVNLKFQQFATATARAMGTAHASGAAFLMVVVWIGSGFFVGFVDAWSFIGNDILTIITFWMVFVIQNTQNRETSASQAKLDEILRALGEARSSLIGLDEETEERIAEVRHELRERRDEESSDDNEGKLQDFEEREADQDAGRNA